MANCMVRCVDIILFGLQYRFLSYRIGGMDINHDDGEDMTKVLGQ